MGGEVAIVDQKRSVSTLSEDVVPSPSSDLDLSPVASIPVSMVVHGGTGILHGNMTSLTVNQYIGMVPDRGGAALWDTEMVRELVADAVKISADANNQLFHPSEPVSKPVLSGLQKKLVKGVGKRRFLVLLPALVISSIALLLSTSLFTTFSPAAPSGTPRPSFIQPFHLPTGTPVMGIETTSALPQNDREAPRIFSRGFWLARPAIGVLTRSILPMTRVIVKDTQTDECRTTDECANVVLNVQRNDMKVEKLQDIGCNFMIGGDGDVYQGRGWDIQGAHTKHNNEASLGVTLIGTFQDVPPNESQLIALGRLINTGIVNYKISPNYTLLTHCQLREDGYPGKALALALSTWDHFDNSLPISKCK